MTTSKLMQWPGEDEEGLAKPASFEDIIEPIIDTLRAYYDITPKNIDATPVYEGFDHHEQHIAGGILWQLSPTGMIYNMEHDRDVLSIMITHAVQLGIEQGRRVAPTRHPFSLWKISHDFAELQRTGLYKGKRLFEAPEPEKATTDL